MRSRAMLHFSKVAEFCAWAAERGWERSEPKGTYEVFRLVRPGHPPVSFHARASASEHVTAWGVGLQLVAAFLRAKRAGHDRRPTPGSAPLKAQREA